MFGNINFEPRPCFQLQCKHRKGSDRSLSTSLIDTPTFLWPPVAAAFALNSVPGIPKRETYVTIKVIEKRNLNKNVPHIASEALLNVSHESLLIPRPPF